MVKWNMIKKKLVIILAGVLLAGCHISTSEEIKTEEPAPEEPEAAVSENAEPSEETKGRIVSINPTLSITERIDFSDSSSRKTSTAKPSGNNTSSSADYSPDSSKASFSPGSYTNNTYTPAQYDEEQAKAHAIARISELAGFNVDPNDVTISSYTENGMTYTTYNYSYSYTPSEAEIAQMIPEEPAAIQNPQPEVPSEPEVQPEPAPENSEEGSE